MNGADARARAIARARLGKAVALEAVLRAAGCTPADLDAFTDLDRRTAERAAGTRAGSPDTWALVRRLLDNTDTL